MIELIVADPVPVFVRVTCCETLPPIATGPKFRLVAEALIVGDPVPVPLALIVAGELAASLTIENVAEAAPAACGLKLIVTVRLPPAGIVDEFPSPVRGKLLDAPVTFTALIVAAPVPVLLTVTCCEELLPTAIEPKFKEADETLSVAEDAEPFEFVPLVPALAAPVLPQPARPKMHASVTAIAPAENRFDRSMRSLVPLLVS